MPTWRACWNGFGTTDRPTPRSDTARAFVRTHAFAAKRRGSKRSNVDCCGLAIV
jgi:hypothetical protein